MSISRITSHRVYPISPIDYENVSSVTPGRYYKFEDKFDFSEIPFKHNQFTATTEIVKFQLIVTLLLNNIVLDGCLIVPRAKLTNGEYQIEASFIPPLNKNQLPQILLPLPIENTIGPVKHTLTGQRQRIINQIKQSVTELDSDLDYDDWIKLIILISHEYGHFVSFSRGYHDNLLKQGLKMLHTMSFNQKNAEYAYQVFSEEATAWRIAAETLIKLEFDNWEQFEQLKTSSLNAYFKLLNLKNANLNIYYKISMLDVNLSQF